MTASIHWQDPAKVIWGFHVHQELDEHDFAKSLVIQSACKDFLQHCGVTVDAEDAIRAGYGPHINPMWELRVETQKTNVLKHLGSALSFMALNRRNLPAYIHPLMHDESLGDIEALKQEGETNQVNVLWYGRRIEQKQDFFFNPPLTEEGKIVDTRTERVLTAHEKEQLKTQGRQALGEFNMFDSHKIIIHGFHIHMDFSDVESVLAKAVYDQFLIYLLQQGLRPTSTCFYGPRENGPHIQAGWEVKFETSDPAVFATMGIAVGWLMCNRQNLSVFMHPVTWVEGDHAEELKAHEQYAFFLGHLPPLDLDFFRR